MVKTDEPMIETIYSILKIFCNSDLKAMTFKFWISFMKNETSEALF